MARLPKNNQILHTDLCPCRSGWMVSSCCLDPVDRKLRKKIRPISPPSPATNFSQPRCYLNAMNDCSEDISREHYISANILEQLGSSISISGAAFLPSGKTLSLSIDNLTSNILCSRHNEALSPLDQEAGLFFSALLESLSDLEKKPTAQMRRLYLASGMALELWMLKVACGVYYSNVLSGSRDQIVDEKNSKGIL